jgi:hypothetical protein
MRISFNVDDTLVLHDTADPGEQVVPWWWRWRYKERLRSDARRLLQLLHAHGHEICIYTTSCRDPRYMRGWFSTFGVPLFEVINQDRHDLVVKKSQFAGYVPSKYPPAFGIDLHVDDSEGVRMEGEQHGFRVVIVSPTDPDWARHILSAVDAITLNRA